MASVLKKRSLQIFGVFTVLFAIGYYGFQMGRAKQFENAAHYGRVDIWMHSSECARERGALLASCTHGRKEVYSVESVVAADDHGHNLIANLYAIVKQAPVHLRTLVRINLTLNFLSLLIFSYVLYRLRYKIAAFCALVINLFICLPGAYPGTDVSASYEGLALLGCSGIGVLLAAIRKPNAEFRPRVYIAAWLLLSAVFVIREPIGLAVWLSCLVLLTVQFSFSFKNRQRKLFHNLAGAFLVMILSIKSPILLSESRYLLFPSMERGNFAVSHGFSHNALGGLLAAPENPWFHRADDPGIAMYVNQTYPNTGYSTKAYFKAATKVYVQILKDYPKEVARIYWNNFTGALNFNARFVPTIDHFYWLISLAVFLVILRKYVSKTLIQLSIGALMFGIAIFSQSILVGAAYLYPTPIVLMAPLFFVPEILWREISFRWSSRLKA